MKSVVIALAAGGWLAGVSMAAAPAAQPTLSGSVKIDGSSTVYPITEAVAEEFKKSAPNVNVTVGISGTGGGFKRFGAGEIDISDASRSIKKEEHDKCVESKIEYIELPIAYDGLTIVVHPKNTWVDKLTVTEVKKIFTESGGAKLWSDVRPGFPQKPIKIFSPGTDSGTFDYFKEVVAGKDGSMRQDMSVSEDDNVLVRGVAGDEGAVGFFGCAYYFENQDKVKSVPIDAEKGKGAISPTPETIENGTYAPFSRPLFIYVNKKSAARPEVKAFIEFYMKNASKLSAEVGYVSLPKELYERATKNWTAGKTGTQFLNDKGEAIHGALSTVYK